MRIAFIVLLIANLGFMAWAIWVDTPPQAQTTESTSRLPRLKLVTEASPPRAQGVGASAAANKVSVTPSSGDAPAVDASKPAAGSDEGSAATTPPEPTAQNQRCVSVGPFSDLTIAAKAAGALHSSGFAPQQRAVEGDVVEGYWVYIGGVDNVDKADRILKALDKGGFKDAHLMPDDVDGHRISVGLFSDRERADRRAKAAQKLGLKAQLAERTQPGTVYWMDLVLKQTDGAVPIQGLLADVGAVSNSHVSVESCPASPTAAPTINTAASPSQSAPPGTRVPPTTVAGTPQLKEAR